MKEAQSLLISVIMIRFVQSFIHPPNLITYSRSRLTRRILSSSFQYRSFVKQKSTPTSTTTTSSASASSTSSTISSWQDQLKTTIHFPTWVVPSVNCQAVLRSQTLKPYLGTVDHVHPRLRLVKPYNQSHQLILCNPHTESLSNDALQELKSLDVILQGPWYDVHLTHSNFTVSYILQQLLPSEVHPPPTAFEQIGHVAHLNLRSIHLPYKNLIGEVLVACHPSIQTVVNKVGEVSGDYRTYDMELLAGKNDTRVTLMENGIKFKFDIKDVYWCSRLSGERDYMIQHVIQENQVICDPFCGVGALLIQAAVKKNCQILANDWNIHAINACRQNAIQNHVLPKFHQISNQDAYDFLTDIGLSGNPLPHHVMMNFPLLAPKFLSALRWWPAPNRKQDVIPQIHVYTFAREEEDKDDNKDDNESISNQETNPSRQKTVQQVAIDLVAENLLPTGGAVEKYYEYGRQEELNDLGCNVQTRIIRDVAPGKVVVCVSFLATKQLIKHIQGDFV